MSIASEITRINNNIANAYTECNNKGATMPQTQNSTNLATTIASISGGSSVEIPEKDVNFYAYDGTVVASYTKNEFLALESLPANPTYDDLTSEGWNWTLSNAKTYVTEYGGLDIGDMCYTTDGTLKIYVTFTDPDRLSPYLGLNVNGTLTIDWGDNRTSTLSGTSITVAKKIQHVYNSVGSYVITVTIPSNAAFRFINGVSGSGGYYSKLFTHTSATNSSSIMPYYLSCITKILLPKSRDINLGENSLAGCDNLKCINLHTGINLQSGYIFYNCSSLKYITISTSTNRINNYVFTGTANLKRISLPKEVVSLYSYAFQCSGIERIWLSDDLSTMQSSVFAGYSTYTKNSLKKIVMPPNITNIQSNLFYYQTSLSTVEFKGDVTALNYATFQYCPSIRKMYFKNNTTVPTLNNSTFSGTSEVASDMKIIVPDNLYDSWKTTSNWSNYASFIFKESQE